MQGAETVDVSISPDLERFVREQVDTGTYSTADEVIAEALRLLQRAVQLDQAKLVERRGLVAVGLEQAEHGDLTPFNAASIRAEGRRRLARRKDEGLAHAPRTADDAGPRGSA